MRQTRTPTQAIRAAVKGEAQEHTRVAFLATDYPGFGTLTHIQFTDPSISPHASGIPAIVHPGAFVGSLLAGTPVTVIVRRGQAVIVGLPAGSNAASVDPALFDPTYDHFLQRALSSSATGQEWQRMPFVWGVRISRGTAFNHTSSGNWLDISSWDNTAFDPLGIFDGTKTLTIPSWVTSTSLWDLMFRIRFASNSTGDRGVGYTLNGGAVTPLTRARAGINNENVLTSSYSTIFAAGDQIVLQTFQDSGGNLNNTATSILQLIYRGEVA